VTAKDAFGNIATGYTGTVTFTSSDSQASFVPTFFTFTAANAGVRTFINGATLRKVGTQSITATDTSNGLTASENGIVVSAATAASLTTAGFPNPIAGVPPVFPVTARDSFGNVATGYTGTVTFTSSDPQAVFSPLTYTFTTADAGIHAFSA